MRIQRHILVFAVTVVAGLVLGVTSSVMASSANISHSYKASDGLLNGTLVSLDPSRANYVQPASTDNGSRLIGIVVAGNDSLLAVDANNNSIQVATSGIATALVSTVNGDIRVGDQIGVSSFSGIGMKALPGSHVIGLAQTAFSNQTTGVNQEVTNKEGAKKTIRVGYVRVSIAIGTAAAAAGKSSQAGLQGWAASITGHQVSMPRIIISLIVGVVALASLITLIYAAIYGSIISIGRNPLAKSSVFRTLGSVVGLAVLTAGMASLTIFFLLR